MSACPSSSCTALIGTPRWSFHSEDDHAQMHDLGVVRFFASLKITKTDTISVIAVARLMARLE
jgi:hypothetical protein